VIKVFFHIQLVYRYIPVIMSALRDPHITKAYTEFTRDPAEFAKYKGDPKVAEVAQRVLELVVASNNPSARELEQKQIVHSPRFILYALTAS
jgi:cytochrome oxidase Cu insertion factor (SCO1/SenC/PrrC family)